MTRTVRASKILELYAGIGGAAAAVPNLPCVAVDQDRDALAVYQHNFEHPTRAWNLMGVAEERLAAIDADLWWLSPPCQPFTIRGARRDVDDPRCQSFLRLIRMLSRVRPRWVGLENVPGFAQSEAARRLRRALEGYTLHERLLCPTDWGHPNRRRRYYLLAMRDPTDGPPCEEEIPGSPPVLRDLVGRHPELRVPDALFEAYQHAIHVVDAHDPGAVATCFTSAYGRSPVRSGSLLRQEGVIRWFSPREIAAVLGFPESFALPPGLDTARAWSLVGNSVNVQAVRKVLSTVPGPKASSPSRD